MPNMFVTLEVSKLSGWLNAYAPCRESKGGHTMRGELRARTTAAHAACRGRFDYKLGAGHGEERTWNMRSMFATLEVSKPSGWLNAYAVCRESKRGRQAMRGAAGDRGARSVQGRTRLWIWGRAHWEDRTLNM